MTDEEKYAEALRLIARQEKEITELKNYIRRMNMAKLRAHAEDPDW